MNCFCFVVVSLFFNTTFHSSDKRDLVQFVHPRLSIGQHYGHCTLSTYRPTRLPTFGRYVGGLSVKGIEEKSYALTGTTTKMYCRSH